jgi:hypothetical protein
VNDVVHDPVAFMCVGGLGLFGVSGLTLIAVSFFVDWCRERRTRPKPPVVF